MNSVSNLIKAVSNLTYEPASVLLPQRGHLQPGGRPLQVPPRLHRHSLRGALPRGLLGRGLLRGLPVQEQQLCLRPHTRLHMQVGLVFCLTRIRFYDLSQQKYEFNRAILWFDSIF